MATWVAERAKGVDHHRCRDLAAVGTVAAAILALVQISDERSARQRTETERAQQETRHQAEQVSAWPGCDG